jgi:hypothetical protein
MGMKERGGKVAARVIPDVKRETLRAVVLDNVEPGSVISTDELMSYGLLTSDGFVHGRVKHAAKEWTYYDYRTGEIHSTNSIESFSHLFKYSVRSTHIQISRDKLRKRSLKGASRRSIGWLMMGDGYGWRGSVHFGFSGHIRGADIGQSAAALAGSVEAADCCGNAGARLLGVDCRPATRCKRQPAFPVAAAVDGGVAVERKRRALAG